MIRLVTIGVYGSTERKFFDALVRAKVDVFCDIRLRRGMRGATYSFANSSLLQRHLGDIGIRYVHFLDLAPTKEIRAVQKNVDNIENVTKSERQTLSPEFVKQYEENILSRFQPNSFIERTRRSQVAALFCVEREPQACHRSLAARFFSQNLNIPIEDLKP